MKNFDDSVDLRSIQQYLYCPHRFGLMENDCSWAENAFVSRGNLAHERVTEGKITSSRGTIQERSVRVFNDEWGLFGVLDCLELKKDKNGVSFLSFDGKYSVSIVEYKISSPKNGNIRIEDRMQLLGQKICVDALFSCNADTYFYYHDARRREKVEFSEDDYQFLRETLEEIRKIKCDGIIPPIRMDQYCSGCSMKDICLPGKRSRT